LEVLRLSQLLYSHPLSDKRVASATHQTHRTVLSATKMPTCCLFAPLQEYRRNTVANTLGECRRTAALLRCKSGSPYHDVKISLAKFSPRATLRIRAEPSQPLTADEQWRAKMAWKAPKILEVPVGMEINMYACAARK
jgi:coenzyme PQQ precursor peptide PqqA